LNPPRGEQLLKKDKANEPEAEAGVLLAIELARSPNATIRELQARVSLARLRCRQDRLNDGRTLLTLICSWFTEGIETADVKVANAIPAELL
jgi:predicted ATPase